MTTVVLLGAPGAGKGTQAVLLRDRLGIPHIATGDLFRAAVRDGSALGVQARRYMERGQLVSDEITVKMLLDRLAEPDARDGAILDGFPRTRVQAEALDAALAAAGSQVDRALLVEVPERELVRRLAGRWICSMSGHVYNLAANPPQIPGTCDLDGSNLVQRADDKLETVQARLRQQLAALADVVDHYRDANVLAAIDGLQPIPDVTEALVAALAAARSAG
ncbi:MAG: adenylate kinase [Chloroflexota bacterium]